MNCHECTRTQEKYDLTLMLCQAHVKVLLLYIIDNRLKSFKNHLSYPLRVLFIPETKRNIFPEKFWQFRLSVGNQKKRIKGGMGAYST